jgi:hypothetical protein
MSKWFLEQRLNFIYDHLFKNEEINRKNIMDKFDVSVAVASHDLKKFQDQNPNTIFYDKNKKKYLLNNKTSTKD